MIKSLKELVKSYEYGSTLSTPKKSFTKKNSTKESFDFLHLVKLWPDIIGSTLSKHTIPLKNNSGVLTILTDHSAFSHQLNFMQDALIKKIVKAIPDLQGRIKKIQYQVNSAFFCEKKKIYEKMTPTNDQKNVPVKLHPYSPEYKKLKKLAEAEFSNIEDSELKERLTSIFVQSKI